MLIGFKFLELNIYNFTMWHDSQTACHTSINVSKMNQEFLWGNIFWYFETWLQTQTHPHTNSNVLLYCVSNHSLIALF